MIYKHLASFVLFQKGVKSFACNSFVFDFVENTAMPFISIFGKTFDP
jgi:hypothetical protein